MECKSGCHEDVSCCYGELIDTLWNVNYVFSDATLFGAGELIDTLWNVNDVSISEKFMQGEMN